MSSVDAYLEKREMWKEELQLLRKILLKTELEETLKWGAPTYTINGKNVVGIGAFKSYFGLWFFQGVFLKDPESVLINASEGKTKGLRQWRFQSRDEIDPDLVKAYVDEAVENQKKGKMIKAEVKKLEIPDILSEKLKSDPHLKAAFSQLTPRKQREYAEYISEAKRAATRQGRLEKSLPLIKKGKGLYDAYK